MATSQMLATDTGPIRSIRIGIAKSRVCKASAVAWVAIRFELPAGSP